MQSTFNPNRPMMTPDQMIKEKSQVKRIKTQDMRKIKFIRNFDKEFVVLRTLGQGSFGEVFEARSIQTGIVCAIKRITKAQMMRSETSKKLMHQELEVLQ